MTILFRFLIKNYFKTFFYVICCVFFIFLLANLFDIFTKFKVVNLSWQIFIKLLFLKLPYLFNSIWPLISFISTLFFINFLMKDNQIFIIFSAKKSLNYIILNIIVYNFFLGILIIFFFTPFSTRMLVKYEDLQDKVLQNFTKTKKIALMNHNVDEKVIIYAAAFIDNQLIDLTVILVDKDYRFLKRIDAKKAYLEDSLLKLKDITVLQNEHFFNLKNYDIPVNFDVSDLEFIKLPIDHVVFWEIPSIISVFSRLSIPIRYYLYFYYKELFKPVLMVSMALVPFCFISFVQKVNFIVLIKILNIGAAVYFSFIFLLQLLINCSIYFSIGVILLLLMYYLIFILGMRIYDFRY